MTLANPATHADPAGAGAVQADAVARWAESGTAPLRGTVVVLPGRGESAEVYERFGRRLASDSYRVYAVTDPTTDEDAALGQLRRVLEGAAVDQPRIVVGSDAGALFAAHALAHATVDGVDALVAAGLPVTVQPEAPAGATSSVVPTWDGELDARTACPTHRGRITAGGLRAGDVYHPVPARWLDASVPAAVPVPVLGLHGSADTLAALDDARRWLARVPRAELIAVTGGRHDILNDVTHRTVAAAVVQFLEWVKLGAPTAKIAQPVPLHGERAA